MPSPLPHPGPRSHHLRGARRAWLLVVVGGCAAGQSVAPGPRPLSSRGASTFRSITEPVDPSSLLYPFGAPVALPDGTRVSLTTRLYTPRGQSYLGPLQERLSQAAAGVVRARLAGSRLALVEHAPQVFLEVGVYDCVGGRAAAGSACEAVILRLEGLGADGAQLGAQEWAYFPRRVDLPAGEADFPRLREIVEEMAGHAAGDLLGR